MGSQSSAPTTSKSITEAITRYKTKCCLGEFAAAEDILSEFPQHWLLDPFVASEIVAMRIRQGAYDSAAKLLDTALQLRPTDGNVQEWDLLAVERQYISISLEGALREAVLLSDSLWRRYFEVPEGDSLSDTIVLRFRSLS